MDNFVNEKDYELMDGDRYTFFVLKRLLSGDNTLLLSDHEQLIICFSNDPFPVWIWTPDGAPDEDLERAYMICRENGLMRKVGYIPEKDNAVFSRLMDAGKLLTAKVKKIDRKGDFSKIEIEIFLTDF